MINTCANDNLAPSEDHWYCSGSAIWTIPSASSSGPPANALVFVPIQDCRIVDTRTPSPTFGTSLSAGEQRVLDLTKNTCGVPSDAAAYAVNVTVVPHGHLGYLTIWPSGSQRPTVSTLNSLDGRTKANAAIVPAGADGQINVYATDATDLVLDVSGYFIPAIQAAGGLQFYPLTPCRVFDTRSSAFIEHSSSQSFAVQDAGCGVPKNAEAYSLNLTAVPRGVLNYLTVWSTGDWQLYTSTLNAVTGAITANAAIVPAGASGAISAFASDDTDLVADINGYFAPPGTGGLYFYTAAPCRVYDSRSMGSTKPISGSQTIPVTASTCGPPSTAKAFVLNATVVPSSNLRYLTLWPDATAQPFVSTLNALDGSITSNMAIVPSQNGSIDAFTTHPSHLILDISGYFAP